MTQHTQNNVDPLPFQNINDYEFETLNDINMAKSYRDMDRLSQLRFNPFETNQNIALSGNNFNLDLSFNANKIPCDYYLPEDFKKNIENLNAKEKFSLIHLNIKSISNKFDSLKNLIDTMNIPFQIIGLTETWLNENNQEYFALKNYDHFGSSRPNKKGGGVAIYVSNQLESKPRNDLTKNIEDSIETKFIEINNKYGKNIIIGVIYRPPNHNFDQFEQAMNKILQAIDRENKICYLMGDFNIDLLKSESCDYSNKFIEQLFTSSFLPLINKPTRITNHTATLIDNIFTNNLENIENSKNGIIFTDISDHLPVVHMFNINILAKIMSKTGKITENAAVRQRNYNKANISAFKDAIKNVSWSEVLNEKNSSEKAFNEFMTLFMEMYNKHFPLELKQNKSKINKTKSPWMTKCILKSVRNKNKLYRAFLMNPNDKDRQKYTKYKNKLNHIIKVAKKMHYEEQLVMHKQNSKMVWKTLNQILNKPNKNSKIAKSFVGNNSTDIIDDPIDIANKFNDYFVKIGPNLANQININDETFEKFLSGSYQSSFSVDVITENELETELENINSNKSSGYDGVNSKIKKFQNH
jgi:hypothetical protein